LPCSPAEIFSLRRWYPAVPAYDPGFGSLPVVEQQNYLGIYIARQGATVACLGGGGSGNKLLGCFRVSAEESEQHDWDALARLITEGCTQRELKFSEVAVALDCALFTQHSVHSEFADRKQVASTVRFDAEDALATDIADVAVAFKIDSTDESGSNLTVFTAKRKVLGEILTSLQSNNLDPVTMEPDINCLAGFIRENVSVGEDSHPVFGCLSARNAYMIAFPSSQKSPAVRTFLIDPGQDRNELLERQLPVTVALFGAGGEAINGLRIIDSAGSVNCQRLSEKLGFEADMVDLAQALEARPQDRPDADPLEVAIACGCCLVAMGRFESINFRSDFSPFAGRKMRLQKALKFLSVSVTVLLLAVGTYLQLQVLEKSRYRSRLRSKFTEDYLAVMLAEKRLPAKTRDAVKKLGTEYRRIESEKKGLLDLTGKKAVSAKLQLLLEAFNRCAARTALEINSVSITTKSINIAGSTSSRPNTLKLRNAIKQTNLGSLQERLQTKGNRDSFNITIMPER